MTTTITDTLMIEMLKNNHNVKIINDNDLNSNIITVKSLLFDIGNEETYLILLDIKRTVNITKLSQYFNNESRIHLTPKEKAEKISGCRMGTVHPLSSYFSCPVPIIIDKDIVQYDSFYAGSGNNKYSTHLNVNDIINLASNEVKILDISSIKSYGNSNSNGNGNSKINIDINRSNNGNSNININRSNNGNSNNGNSNSNTMIDDRKAHIKDVTIDNPFELKPFINRIRKVATTSNIEKFSSIMIEYDKLVEMKIIDINTEEHPLDIPSINGKKSALQLACWRGDSRMVKELLKRGSNINAYSKSSGNYGKTAIFYALTRCRDDVVLMLLESGANVKIVNNKGQSPLSLSITHCNKGTIEAIENAELSQKHYEWINFQKTHSDGMKYGDLDTRFIDDEELKIENDNDNDNYNETDGDNRVLKPTNFRSRFIHRDDCTTKSPFNIYNDLNMELFENCGNDIQLIHHDNRMFYTFPSPSESGYVEINCKIIAKRHIGKALMFGTVIPSCITKEESNKFCWILNSTEKQPLACQIIIGKTVRESIGDELARRLCKALKIGSNIIIQGKYSPSGLPAPETNELAGINEVVLNKSGLYKPLNYNSQYENTVDIVVHKIKLVDDGTSSNIDLNSVSTGVESISLRPSSSGISGKDSLEPVNCVTLQSLGELSQKQYSIILVNDSHTLTAFVSSVTALAQTNHIIIGIDAEWRPSISKQQKDIYPVSIIQLSFLDQIFIIDLQTLHVDNGLMTILNDSLHILEMGSIKLLGLGISYDLKRIIESYPSLTCFQKISNTVDVQEIYNLKYGNTNKKNIVQGLSSISKQLFGRTVDKTEQTSSWHVRPLRNEQIIYASIDSAILEVLYSKLLD